MATELDDEYQEILEDREKFEEMLSVIKSTLKNDELVAVLQGNEIAIRLFAGKIKEMTSPQVRGLLKKIGSLKEL